MYYNSISFHNNFPAYPGGITQEMSSQISPRIEVRAISIRGLPHEVLLKYPKNAKLTVSCEVFGVRKETTAVSASGALVGQEVQLRIFHPSSYICVLSY